METQVAFQFTDLKTHQILYPLPHLIPCMIYGHLRNVVELQISFESTLSSRLLFDSVTNNKLTFRIENGAFET